MHRRMGVESFMGIGGGAVSRESNEALEMAEELIYQGQTERALSHLHRAMNDPNNLDACSRAASLMPKKKAIEILLAGEQTGREALKRSLGPTCFQDDNVGHFWGLIQTRPYMRLLDALVETYLEDKQLDKAIDIIVEMLRLCPTDNIGRRDWLGSLLLRTGRAADALYFSQVWLESSSGDGSPPPLGGCDFKAPISKPLSEDSISKLSKWPSDAMSYSAALSAFKLYGDCLLARQYLRIAAKSNKTILIRILARIPQPKTPNSGARTMNGTDSAHDYLWLVQNLWMKSDAWNWANSDEEAVKLILRECCAPDCTIVETLPNEFKRCAACKMTWYCGTPCQKKHWPGHKTSCKEWNQQQAMIQSIVTGQPFQRP